MADFEPQTTGQAFGVSKVYALDDERPRVGELADLAQAAMDEQRRLREVAEGALGQSTAILESMSEGFIAIDANGLVVRMNAAAERIGGQLRSAIVGERHEDFFRGLFGPGMEPRLRRARTERVQVEFESLDHLQGRWLANRLSPMPGGGLAVFFQEFTEVKRAQLNLELLASISRDLLLIASEDDMMRTVGARIGGYLQLSHCAFAEIHEAADLAVIAHDWHRDDATAVVGGYRLSKMLDESFHQATRSGQVFVVNDTQTDPRTDGANYAAIGVGAFLSVPLLRDGEARFLLALARSSASAWRDDEVSVMREVADRIWRRLEGLRAEASVRVSEQRYRTLFNAIDEGFYIAEVLFDEAGQAVDHRILEANPAFTRHSGVKDPVGKTARELVPGMESFWNEMFGRVAIRGELMRFENGSDATQRWFDVFVSRVGDESSRKVAIVFNDVSERRRAAQALRARTAQFETLLNEAPLGMYLIDAQFRVRAVNPTALPTFAGVADLIGRDFAEVMHIVWPPDRADSFVQIFRHTLATGEPFSAPEDTEVRYDSGVKEYHAWQISRIALPEGGYGVVCYFRDISAQVLAREALAQGEALWRGLFESLHEGFLLGEVVHDADGKAVDWRYLEMNVGWERVTGLSREAAYGKTLRELIPDVEPEWIHDFIAVAQTSIPANFTRHVAALNRWYEVHAFCPKPGRFAALFLDVTDRHLAQLRQRESEQRLQFVMDSMPQKIFTARPDGEIDYLNPQWAQFTGLLPDQIRDWGRAGFIHPDDLAETMRIWRHGFTSGEGLQIENRFRRADGQYRWHLNRVQPLQGESGQISMWIGSSTDIHEQKSASAALQALTDALTAADQRKTEFLATLAHELRNPLAPISNAVQTLQRSGVQSAAVGSTVKIISRQVAQLVRLVDDLLDVSRITQGKIELRLERLDLTAVLVQAAETSEPALQADHHGLTLSYTPESLWLNADPVRLAQIFGNLLSNAVKYGLAGGHISVTASREGEWARVSVTDNGIGIAPEKIGNIFDMFSQVDPSLERARGGLGIGLMLVQKLVELHGGTVEAHSVGLGRGSEFVVRLPLALALDESALVLEPPGSIPASTGAVCRALVIDDNADAAETLSELLDVLGVENRVAFGGLQGLREAEVFRPNLVLLDIGMPGLNGFEVARRLRAKPWGASLRLVALTGWGQSEDRDRSREAGFDQHLVKPLDVDALMRVLGEFSASPELLAQPLEKS